MTTTHQQPFRAHTHPLRPSDILHGLTDASRAYIDRVIQPQDSGSGGGGTDTDVDPDPSKPAAAPAPAPTSEPQSRLKPDAMVKNASTNDNYVIPQKRTTRWHQQQSQQPQQHPQSKHRHANTADKPPPARVSQRLRDRGHSAITTTTTTTTRPMRTQPTRPRTTTTTTSKFLGGLSPEDQLGAIWADFDRRRTGGNGGVNGDGGAGAGAAGGGRDGAWVKVKVEVGGGGRRVGVKDKGDEDADADEDEDGDGDDVISGNDVLGAWEEEDAILRNLKREEGSW